MAKKMHCAPQEISTDSSNISKAGKDSISRKYQQQNTFTSLEDCKKSSLSTTNSDSRCAILAFIYREPDGNCRIVALPVQHFNTSNLVSGVNMNGLQLVLPPPLRLKIDQLKGQRGPLSDYACSDKSYTRRSITASNVRRQCQNKKTSKASKLNELSGNSCSQSSFICQNSSGLFPNSSAAVNSSDMFISNPKVDKSVKKNSRRKARKKSRQSKKQSCDSGSIDPEVLPEEYAQVSLTSEICGSNDVKNEDGLMSHTTRLEFSSSVDRLIKNHSKRNGTDASVDLTEAPRNVTSFIDEVERPEGSTPIVQKFTGESATCNSGNQLEIRAPEFAVIDRKAVDLQQIQLCCYKNMCSKISSDIQDSLVLDSVSVGSNSDESSNANGSDKQANKASCRIGLSEPPGLNSGDGHIVGQNILNGFGSTYNHDEGIRNGAQNCSSNDKRVKQKRTVSRSSSVNKFGGAGNMYGRIGKENSHSVWQKVQKNDSDENGDLKKVSTTFSQTESTLKKAPSLNRNGNSVGVDILSKSEDKKHLQNTVSRKSKGKMDPSSKKGYCSYYKKESHSSHCILNDNEKVSVQQNGMPHISSQEYNQKGLSCVSGSHSHIDSQGVGFQANRVERITSESVHSEQGHLEELDPPKSVYHTISTMKNQNLENQDSSLLMPCDRISQLSMSEKHSSMCSHLLGNKIGQIEKDVSSADYNTQNYNSGSTLWKWIPTGKKGTRLAFSESDSSSLEYYDEPPSKDFTLERNVEPNLVSFSQNYVTSLDASRICVDQICSNSDEDLNQKLGDQVACAPTEHRDKHVIDNYLIHECQSQEALENDLYRKAMNDACKAQAACEAVHMATGGPIAEFERLLHFCCPVICQSPSSRSCLTCSWDYADSGPLCRHEIPDRTLGCLWQWYEKPGSYGLEIKAQDYEIPKRPGVGRFPFRAYFVPSLSAVQLFKICKNQPHVQDASITPTNQVCYEAPSDGAKHDASSPSISSAYSGDLELLFEYFESEQPHQRQPLNEKIQELVRGEIPAQSKVYGDPTGLDSINLQDLHPRSWYSVAWYPIYRIPDGHFRAAFLTYHSLGHLVGRSIETDLPNVESCIVSPVVGLQSYNAQGEGWFQLRHSALTAEKLGLNPSALLKERLRILEETASLMARAVIKKGDLICTNRHPDYEFFLSRQRY